MAPEDDPADDTDPNIDQATDDQLRTALWAIHKDIKEGVADPYLAAQQIAAIERELESRK